MIAGYCSRRALPKQLSIQLKPGEKKAVQAF